MTLQYFWISHKSQLLMHNTYNSTVYIWISVTSTIKHYSWRTTSIGLHKASINTTFSADTDRCFDNSKLVKKSRALNRTPISELWGVTCHMGSHSVTCHLTQVNIPHLNPSQAGRYSIYLPQRDGRLSWPRWMVTYWDGLPVTHHPSK